MIQKSKRWIKDGLEVAHKDNPELKLIVRKLKRIRENGTTKIDGVEVHWWEIKDGVKKLSIEKFHTNELVPWEVAIKGQAEIQQWLEQEL